MLAMPSAISRARPMLSKVRQSVPVAAMLDESPLLPELRHAVAQPAGAEFLRQGILLQAFIQALEIDLVERLVLVEAGEYVARFAGNRIAVRLQALRADLLHHALHG